MSNDLPSVFQPLQPEDPREVGGYRVFARLGAGGMGRVYLSYTPGGRPVALKVVRAEFAEDGEFRRRFAQEVANAQRIHGLYTAQVIDAGPDAGAPWLVTAYVPGPSLQQVIREHGALPPRTVLLLVGGIAEALQAIHSVQVVHRDLKPANVLVASDGPRVIDFGIARAADATALTGTGYRIGSPAFMSPEQAQGGPVTAATDVFALGALAAYAAGGAPPFGEGPDTAVLYRVVHEEPDLSAVPAGLRELLARCLAKDPAQRPTPAEVIEAARSHPAVGGQLRFADDWLPDRVNTEITRRSDLPRTPPTPLPVPPAAPPMPTVPATAPSIGAPPAAAPQPPAAQYPVPQAHRPMPQYPTAPDGAVPPPSGAFGPPQPAGAPAVPVAPGPQPGRPGPDGPVRRGVSWKTLLVVAAATAVVGTAVGVALTSGSGGDGGRGGGTPTGQAGGARTAGQATAGGSQDQASPGSGQSTAQGGKGGSTGKPAGGYTAVYTDQVLSSPDLTYVFDLTTGKVVSGSTSPAWALEPGYGHYNWSSGSDAFLTTENHLTPAECAAGVEQQPVADVKYDALPVGGLFCLRNRENGGIVVVKTVEQGSTSNARAKVSISYFRRNG
ncbi:serine/threonine-protein kinase [Streptomyces sp. NRRL B-24484]|uniref:serine/threonine-protein kinase n=1 Tax=Streptomyces sp. NRRL B-24484 TaxID=1463833 RepID=UPI000693F5CC|nr:serine/threonine-protein kinase [Streptomyces sp. NRRL B-24484]